MHQSLSTPFLFCIAAQILPWICQLHHFLQKLFCSLDIDSPSTADSNSNDSNHVVGGVIANISEAPYMLSIQIFDRHFCVAVIISSSWALSAAQCFPQHYSISKMHLQGGSNLVPDSLAYRYNLEKVYIHHWYELKNRIPWHDIAVIKPKINFLIIEQIMETIPLVPEGSNNAGSLATIFGWGALKQRGYSFLHKEYIPLIAIEECKKYMEDVPYYQHCAGYLEGGVGQCYGKAGGPYVVENLLEGIFSWSEGCGRPKYPDYYTGIRHYRKWIKSKTSI